MIKTSACSMSEEKKMSKDKKISKEEKLYEEKKVAAHFLLGFTNLWQKQMQKRSQRK
jgi:hypothetical protein